MSTRSYVGCTPKPTPRERDIRDLGEREHRYEDLVARLRREADVRDEKLAELRDRLKAAEQELKDLRAIRDALTPPELPKRPGLELAAAYLPAAAQQVSGDFYLVAEGPQDSTLLVIGDVVARFGGPRGVPRSSAPRSPPPPPSLMIPVSPRNEMSRPAGPCSTFVPRS